MIQANATQLNFWEQKAQDLYHLLRMMVQSIRNTESRAYTFPFWEMKQNMFFVLVQTKKSKRVKYNQRNEKVCLAMWKLPSNIPNSPVLEIKA